MYLNKLDFYTKREMWHINKTMIGSKLLGKLRNW